jgi:hypothetical protein
MNYITWNGKGVNLGRKFGGIGWPSEAPGYACIIAEELYPMVGSKVHRLFVLDEVEKQSTNQLFTECANFMGIYNVSDFFGRYDASFMRTLEFWNDQHRQLPQLDVFSAPDSKTGAIGYHLETLKNRLQKDQRTLFFSPESKLPGYLEAIPPGVINTASDDQFPAVAALGYAVAALTELPPDYEEHEDYDPPDDDCSVTGY